MLLDFDMQAKTTPVLLRPYQAEALDAVDRLSAKHRTMMVVSPTGCHAAGHPILMFDGSIKAVEDVEVGDLLMGPDSTPRQVLRLARGRQQMYRITPIKGEPFVVNADHILSLACTNTGKQCDRPSSHIDNITVAEWEKKAKSWKHLRKLRRVPADFAPMPAPPLDAWAMGVLLGDGSLGHGVRVSNPDQELIDRLDREMATFGLLSTKRYDRGCWHIGYARQVGTQQENPVYGILRDLGLAGCLSSEKFIPDVYKRGSRQVRLDILAGLLDTDGSLSCGGYDYITASERMARDVVFVARSLGLAAYCSLCRKSCQNGYTGSYWRISISGDCDMLPMAISRKKAPPRKQIKNPLVTGFSAEPVGEDDFYGFALDGDHLYLDGTFTVHHNTGKTVCFCKLAERCVRERNKRVLILVDRIELVHQTVATIRSVTGLPCDIEQAANYSDERRGNQAPIVVAMVQTLDSVADNKPRRERYYPADFGLVIVDECHLSITERHRRVIDYFLLGPEVVVVGFTATPMRSDGKSLGQVYEQCAFRYDIRDAIDDGWLVPVVGGQVRVESLDLSVLPKKRGDWTDDEIGALMEQNETIYETVGVLSRECRNQPTLVFCARVSHAELMAHALNTQLDDMNAARCIHGETPARVRKRYIDMFRAGEINYLTNCAVLTTGFDAPVVRNVAMCRPTKSPALFIQCVGRGTRPLPGLVDGVEEALDRRSAIAGSDKPMVRVLSFVGRDGGIDLCGPEDVLAGDMDDEVIVRAKEIAAEAPEKSIEERLDQAKEEVEDRRRREQAAPVRADAKYQVEGDDLFAGGEGSRKLVAGELATSGQMKVLTDAGVPESVLRRLRYDKATAGALAQKIMVRRKKGLATYKQCSLLLRCGYRREQYRDMTVTQARELIDRTVANGWRPVQ